MSTYRARPVPVIDTTAGEKLRFAADKINTFFTNLSTDWISFITPFSDARASEVLTIPFSDCSSTVVDYLTGDSAFDVDEKVNLVMDKWLELPLELMLPQLNHYFNPKVTAQKTGLKDTTRALYYNYTTQQYDFANNKALYDNYGEFTGVIGNVYPDTQTVDLVINGVYYDYTDRDLIPGTVYYLTDSLDGWMLPYQEGGIGDSVSLPMSIAVHKDAAILLTDRAVTKQLPCLPPCPPQRLRFMKAPIFTKYLDITDGDPFTDPSVTKYTAYTTIGEPFDPLDDPWNNPDIRKYSLYEEIP
jgi:hypothetical protein